ncbi:MAG: hypothetical protein ABR535_05920 [Pyrinomonadaceae bacterium]
MVIFPSARSYQRFKLAATSGQNSGPAVSIIFLRMRRMPENFGGVGEGVLIKLFRRVVSHDPVVAYLSHRIAYQISRSVTGMNRHG